jgi:hypothetical protein
MARGPQAYGLLDDVAIFNTALTETALATIINDKRLSGHEALLKFGWCFDDQPPDHLDSPATYIRATHVPVLSDRSFLDRGRFYDDAAFGYVKGPVHLPFGVGQIWKVAHGLDEPEGAHNSHNVHSYDFRRVYEPSQANILSASAGNLVQYIKNGGLDSNGLEINVIRIRPGGEPNELLSYLRLAGDSINIDLDWGVCDANSYCTFPGQGPAVALGQFLANVGPNAGYLHFNGVNRTDGAVGTERVTFPVAFDDYWVLNRQGIWQHVDRGYPSAGQLVQRLQ